MVDTAVSKPVESHLHGFGMFGLDMTLDDAVGSAVVGLDQCGGLRVFHLLQYVVYFHSFTCSDTHCSKFCFCGRGNDGFDNFQDGEDCAVVGWKKLAV